MSAVQEPNLLDILQFFENKNYEYTLYQTLEREILTRFPVEQIRVQQSQITFWGRPPFAIVSLRRVKGAPKHSILVTFGLEYRLVSPRIAVAVEPYPNRWTHHVPIGDPGQIDDELMAWIGEAYRFSESKRR